MSDVLKGLAQLKQARGDEAAPAPVKEKKARTTPVAAAPEPAEPVPGRGEEKTLAGRVPIALHRRFARLLLDAADELDANRVYTDEALEAALLLILEDDDARASWMAKLTTVRQQRR